MLAKSQKANHISIQSFFGISTKRVSLGGQSRGTFHGYATPIITTTPTLTTISGASRWTSTNNSRNVLSAQQQQQQQQQHWRRQGTSIRLGPRQEHQQGCINREFSTQTASMAANAASQSNGGSMNGTVKEDSWAAAPGPAAFDLRSDVHTNPTAAMLAAIQTTTLLDDVRQEDPTTNELEAFVADLTGHEAALLVLSGTMGNQVSLRAHLGAPPNSIVTDHRSHIMRYEAGGAASLSGALLLPVTPSNGHHLTLRDIKQHAVLSDNVHTCPTRLISLENTIEGSIVPLDECRRISQWARAHGILMHLDGARLWESVAAGAGSLRDFAACFDSISLCFSKGLGAPVGSIIVGSRAFIARARWVRKAIGGGLRQSGVIAAPARVAVHDTFLGGKLAASHRTTRAVEAMWLAKGGRTTHPVETNMVWLDLKGYGLVGHKDYEDADDDNSNDAKSEQQQQQGNDNEYGLEKTDFTSLAAKHGLQTNNMTRLVIHYQIGDEALARLDKLMDALALRRETILKARKKNTSGQ